MGYLEGVLAPVDKVEYACIYYTQQVVLRAILVVQDVVSMCYSGGNLYQSVRKELEDLVNGPAQARPTYCPCKLLEAVLVLVADP